MAVPSGPGDRPEARGNAAERTPFQSARFVLFAALVLTTCNAGLVALPPAWDVAVAAVLAFLVLAIGRWCGLSWREMGLHPESAPSGLRWGALAVAVVALFYTAMLLLPATRDATAELASSTGRNVWVTALVLVPLRTVILEEVIFRAVLWGMVARRSSTAWALGGSAAAFGLWHVAPALSLSARTGEGATISLFGVIALTTVAGLLFGELRRRSDSLIAPIAMHWATNGLGLIAAYLA
jgi:membrane protease YdiL (CAAX protease family)